MKIGILLSVSATSLFSGLYYFATLLRPLNGEEIFGLRMLLTLPVVTLIMVASKEWAHIIDTYRRVKQKPALLPLLLCSSALLGVQQWLFLWAPLNGSALQVSLGYFLLPLSMVLVGRVFYKEHLTGLQVAAACVAVAGVANALIQAGGISWEALLVCIGFPVYFILRKFLATDHLGGLWFDMLFSLPVAAWLVLRNASVLDAFSSRSGLYFLVILLAVISAIAFMCYMSASRRLPLSLFGLLGYVEPILMTAVALFLGEHIRAEEWMTYLPIWFAVALLLADGIKQMRNESSAAGHHIN